MWTEVAHEVWVFIAVKDLAQIIARDFLDAEYHWNTCMLPELKRDPRRLMIPHGVYPFKSHATMRRQFCLYGFKPWLRQMFHDYIDPVTDPDDEVEWCAIGVFICIGTKSNLEYHKHGGEDLVLQYLDSYNKGFGFAMQIFHSDDHVVHGPAALRTVQQTLWSRTNIFKRLIFSYNAANHCYYLTLNWHPALGP